ncbi:MAG: phage antirepressor KilAC domain-containing protein [Pseudoxanthomonas sp.]
MNALVIADQNIRCDAVGRFSLNDLHRAAGGEVRHQPSNWLRLQQVRELIDEIEAEDAEGASSNLRNRSSHVMNAVAVDRQSGTFVVRELVFSYAMWISPAFHVRCLRALDAMAQAQWSQDATAQRQLSQQSERLEVFAHEVKVLAPKAAAFDLIASQGGHKSLTEAAKLLGMKPRHLTAWLSENAWIYRTTDYGSWVAYQRRIDDGYLTHRMHPVEHAPGFTRQHPQVLVTAKGLARLAELLSDHDDTANPLPTLHRRIADHGQY